MREINKKLKKSSINKDIYKEGTQNNTEIPYTTIGREARNDKKISFLLIVRLKIMKQ